MSPHLCISQPYSRDDGVVLEEVQVVEVHCGLGRSHRQWETGKSTERWLGQFQLDQGQTLISFNIFYVTHISGHTRDNPGASSSMRRGGTAGGRIRDLTSCDGVKLAIVAK